MYEFYGDKTAKQTIIAIPALGERKEMFIPLALKVQNFRILAFDLPGNNGQISEDYSIPSFVRYIKATMKELKIKEAHFIGSSLGAWIIQALAAQVPHVVQSLTLLDGGYYFLGDKNEPYEDVELPTTIEDFEDIRAAVHELTYSIPNLTKECYENFEYYFLNNYIKIGNFFRHHCSEIAYNALAKEITITNHYLQSTDIPMQLLIADGEKDEFLLTKIEQFKVHHPTANVHIIENGHHYLPLTNTDEVANCLSNFFTTKVFNSFSSEI